MRINNFKKFLCWDIESESLSLINSRPWQVSYILFDHSKILEEYDRFPWWADLKISDGAAKATHFNYEDYKSKAEDAAVVFDHFTSYLYDPEIAVCFHNGLQFDVYQLKTWARCINKEVNYDFLDRSIDTNALARAYKTNAPVDKDKFLFWQYKMLSERMKVKTSVATLLKDFGIEHDANRLHEGLYDSQRCVEIFYKLRHLIN